MENNLYIQDDVSSLFGFFIKPIFNLLLNKGFFNIYSFFRFLCFKNLYWIEKKLATDALKNYVLVKLYIHLR